jgi:hypothetical protein
MFLQLRKVIKQKEGQDFLATLVDDMQEDKIDGFCFVETPEKFRFE